MPIDLSIIVALIAGAFAIGVAIIKAFLDRRQAKQSNRDSQAEKALNLYGQIVALLEDNKEASVQDMMEYSNLVKRSQFDATDLAGIVGTLEILSARAHVARTELNKSRSEREALESEKNALEARIDQEKDYSLSMYNQYDRIRRERQATEEEALPPLPQWMHELVKKHSTRGTTGNSYTTY